MRRRRANEISLRVEAPANKLRSKNIKSFWRDKKSHDHKKQSLPKKTDQVCGHQNIADLWREKFSIVLNSVVDEADRSTILSTIREVERMPINLVSPEEICILASGLSNDKSFGIDVIPNELCKYALTFIHDWMATFINGLLTHCHVSAAFTDVPIRPVIKSSLKDPTDSASSRPIALSSSASKIVASVLYERMKQHLTTSSNQFGFMQKNSTGICILVVKETIGYYYSMNTPVFVGFIDIKSAFDRVNHSKLLLKLIERGVPLYLVLLLRTWYKTQRFYAG